MQTEPSDKLCSKLDFAFQKNVFMVFNLNKEVKWCNVINIKNSSSVFKLFKIFPKNIFKDKCYSNDNSNRIGKFIPNNNVKQF